MPMARAYHAVTPRKVYVDALHATNDSRRRTNTSTDHACARHPAEAYQDRSQAQARMQNSCSKENQTPLLKPNPEARDHQLRICFGR